MTEPRWLGDGEQRAWRSFLAMSQRLDHALARHLQTEFGLSGADYLILVTLSEAPDGRMRAYELIESTDWEKSRLSHHLKRMERRGLVCREPTDNARSPEFCLTPAGHQAIVDAAPAHVAQVRRLFFDVVSPTEAARFAATCEKILDALGGTLLTNPAKSRPTPHAGT
ncbi:MarR family winged helix-turn-helix transcriptional regulator [Amycolatopsis sp. NPDC051372]|uniref:MarR family winged helix-turn-helix transcriptional regulator n=1 Tax=Amycolatopsis sp. NPDC051372 TaxID=3155669 RepID=UPI003425BEDD